MTNYSRTYTLTDVANKLGKARTTVAEWTNQFREYLPTIGTGRTMRYKEESLELFALISKMKDVNEPTEYIRDHLRGMSREIVITTMDDDKPFLLNIEESYGQLSDEVRELRSAVQLLTQKLGEVIHQEVQNEIASAAESIGRRIDTVSEQMTTQQRQIDEMTTTLSRVETYNRRSLWERLFGK